MKFCLDIEIFVLGCFLVQYMPIDETVAVSARMDRMGRQYPLTSETLDVASLHGIVRTSMLTILAPR